MMWFRRRLLSVVEGAVRVVQTQRAVQPLRLNAGAEADVTPQKIIPAPKPDIPKAVAWRTRRLVFHSDRLEDVAREFNRYNRIPITLEDATLADRHISGVFDADDPQPLVNFLAQQPGFAVVQGKEQIVVRGR